LDHYIAIVECEGENGDEEPKTFAKAIEDPRWMKAMHEEMDSIQENGTWILVELPPRKNPIFSKWVFKQKRELMKHVSNTKLDLWQAAVSKWKPLIMKTRLLLW
jgi:hypothetical protein